MSEPLMEFKDEEQAYKCLKEWQNKLGLQDWIFKIILCDDIEKDIEGKIEYQHSLKTGLISLIKKPKDVDTWITKFCMEQTLIHEILHPVLDICSYTKPNVEQFFLDNAIHQRVEQMAKSLLMAKYDLSLDWFKNF